MVAESAHSGFIDGTRFWGVGYMLKVRAAIQRDLGWLKKWLIGTSWSLREANVMYMGWSRPMQQYWLARRQLYRKELWDPDGQQLYLSQQCVLEERSPTVYWAFYAKEKPTGQEKRFSPCTQHFWDEGLAPVCQCLSLFQQSNIGAGCPEVLWTLPLQIFKTWLNKTPDLLILQYLLWAETWTTLEVPSNPCELMALWCYYFWHPVIVSTVQKYLCCLQGSHDSSLIRAVSVMLHLVVAEGPIMIG